MTRPVRMVKMSRMRSPNVVAVLGLAALLGGCGGSSSSGTTTTTAKPTAATTAAPATTTTTTTQAAATTPASTTTADATRKDAITVRGRTGDTLTLIGQYATTVQGTPKRRVKVKVTALGVRGPFSGFDLPKGHKLIGIDLRVTNVGDIRYEDALPSGTLILAGGENGKPTNLISSGQSPCDNPSLKLAPGQSKKVCAAFDVPTSAKLLTFQYEVDSGFGDTGLWRLR